MRFPRPLLRAALLSSAAAAAFVAAGSLAACAWSVPADPGMNARQRGGLGVVPAATGPARGVLSAGRGVPRSTARSDDGARAVYLERCGRCHEPFSPRHAAADEWPGIVRKMGPRAGLFGAERGRVLSWLQANAR